MRIPNTEHFCVHTLPNRSPSLTVSIAPEISIAMSDRESLLPRIAPRLKDGVCCSGRLEGARESPASLVFAPGRSPTPGDEDASCAPFLFLSLSSLFSSLGFLLPLESKLQRHKTHARAPLLSYRVSTASRHLTAAKKFLL